MTSKFKFLLSGFAAILFSLSLQAQTISISGTITEEESGETIPGASVLVKGSKTGVMANADGAYTIQADKNATLIFTCLGYKDVEQAVAGRATINVALPSDAMMLEEAIAIGYGTVKKNDLTGSVASVKAIDVVKSSSSSIDKMLQGRVAGLTIIDSSNDSPDASVTVRVRGISSINGSNAPLVVVDGVPFGDAGNLKSVNPNIIESIEVLKDASATAIYGSRGANGVIMITTKNGKEDHMDVWVNTKVGVNVFSRPLDTWYGRELEMAELSNEAYENMGMAAPYMGEVFSDGVYYPSLDEIELGIWPYRTDWTKVVLRNGVTQDYNVGVEGSKGGNRYYASIGYYKGQGNQYNDDYSKFSADFSYQTQVLKRLAISSKAGFFRGNRTYNCGTSYGINPLWPVYNGDGSYFRTKYDDYSNPQMINDQVTNFGDQIQGYLNMKADWTIIDGLVLSLSANGRADQSRSYNFSPPLYTYGGDTYNGEGGTGESTMYTYETDAFLTYTKDWTNHSLSVMAGASYEDRVDRYTNVTGRGFTNATLKYETVDGAQQVITSSGRTEWQLASAFTRINYNYKGRYFATFTARADGSSKFAEGHRWGFFPSGAVSWRLDQEDWVKKTGFFNLLKIRASYGLSGNQGISPYQTFEQYGYDYFWSGGTEYRVYGAGYQSGREGIGNRYVTYAGMANHDLTWEKTAQADAGFDMSIFGGRLDLTLDYYFKRTTDLLRKQYLPPNSGFDTVWVNDGVVNNQGFEMSITGRIVDTRDWTFTATGILSLNRNKVVQIGTVEDSGFSVDANGIKYTAYGSSVYDSSFLNVLAIGYPINSFYGFMVNGILQEEIGDGTSPMTAPGEFNYVGLKEDGSLDYDQRTIIGNPNPKFTGSLALNLSHRIGLDFSVMLYGVYGNDIFSYRKLDSPAVKADRWTYDEPDRYRPKLRYNRSYYASSWFVEDGSFLRVSNITLGYTLSDGYVKWLKGLRVYVSANNPFTFFKASAYDPEVGENGNGNPAFPKVCTITTGLEFKF